MKYLLTLTALITFTTAQAAPVPPVYYSVDFQIEKIEPMCPRSIPAGAVCMGLGSVVTLGADLGCGDKMVYSDFETMDQNGSTVVHAVSVVKASHSRTSSCSRNKVLRTLTIPHGTVSTVVNLPVHSNQ
ncbi:MAG TPA: hypothetical protein VNJ01_01210 [Bacteriovoracaceae bacterium]|nr:hypothetical protein [Bacteriovoracaceae bacterium]